MRFISQILRKSTVRLREKKGTSKMVRKNVFKSA